MTKTILTLPCGYTEYKTIDLQHDTKLAVLINLASLLVGVGMVFAASFFMPLSDFIISSAADPSFLFLLKLIVICVGSFAYILLHEAVHGIFIRRFSGVKAKFGFTGLYAFAGSSAYFCRKHYIVIALAPVVLWGIALTVLSLSVPRDWFYVAYIIQVFNISGAAGDIYVTAVILKMPPDILICDSGTSMKIFKKTAAPGEPRQQLR